MLIVLEGLDGAGKSTQVKKLKEYLQGRCGALEYIHFPRYDAPVYGELISRFLRETSAPTRACIRSWWRFFLRRTATAQVP